MPIPKPGNDETRQEFIQRCMANEVMKDEYPKSPQRFAVCISEWQKKNEQQLLDVQQSPMESTTTRPVGQGTAMPNVQI